MSTSFKRENLNIRQTPYKLQEELARRMGFKEEIIYDQNDDTFYVVCEKEIIKVEFNKEYIDEVRKQIGK